MKEEYKKAYKITMKLIDGNIKNLRYSKIFVPGIITTFLNYGIKINSNTLQAFKDATIDFLYDYFGVEPTFYTDEVYEWWENLNPSTYNKVPEKIFEDFIQ